MKMRPCSQISWCFRAATLVALTLMIASAGSTFAAGEPRRSVSDLLDNERDIRGRLNRDGPAVGDRPFVGCLDAVANPWEDCAQPAFAAIPSRQVAPERGEDFEGIQSYGLRYEENGKVYYVTAAFVPRDKRNDSDIAFLFETPDENVVLDDLGIPGANYKPLPEPDSVFNAMATGELIDATGNSQTYEYYASLVIDFMCDGMSVGVGVDQVIPRNLGLDGADAMARQLWQANLPEVRSFTQQVANTLRNYEVCVPGISAIASLTNAGGAPNASLQQGDTLAPIMQDFFDTFFREGYAQESAAFGWANGTVEEGGNTYSFPAGTAGLEQ